ncbi:hypothetical protein [Spirillospora sp. NPDC048819]|uniref:hypothetical protein n=1 Tax=Spirillospora sp. NPDC048819 TaxID=3155268 RepID=UPI0033F701C6
MTSISIPTCNRCDQLNGRNVIQRRLPRISTSGSGAFGFRSSPKRIRARLRSVFRNNHDQPQPRPTSHRANTDPQPLAHAFGGPEGAGLIGPGADGLLRAAFTEALTHATGARQVITTKPDLDRLFAGAFDEPLIDNFAPRLHAAETLEDAIEYIELEDCISTAIDTNDASSAESPVYVWFATPGPDADVVHETLQRWHGTNLIALMSGAWPYGPTHFIDADGPRRLPDHNLHLLPRDQAITRLRALGSQR